MNLSIIQAALTDLQSKLDWARDAKQQIEATETGKTITGGGFVDPEAALISTLNDLYEILLVVLEAAELRQARTRLMGKWHELAQGKGVGATSYNGEFDYLECPAFEYLDTLIEALRVSSSVQAVISGEIYGDFVTLAKNALKEGAKDVAAVLACAALEDALKRFALMNGLDVSDKGMQEVVGALKSKGLVGGAQKTLLDTMPKIRDYTMHANWEKITQQDIGSVIGFVEQFLLANFS